MSGSHENVVYQHALTRREFRQRMGTGQLKAVLVPLGALEQHLEHLAMEHDWRSVNHVAREIAQRLTPHVLIAQTLMAGISEHHMRYAGTISLRPGTFLSVLFDVVDSLVRAGWKTIIVINGHGGNVAPCLAAWDQLVRQYPVNAHFLSYWDVLNEDDARQLLTAGHRLPDDLPGHAQEFETSIARSAFPENIRSPALADQPDPAPALATADQGSELLRRIVDRLTERIRRWIDGSDRAAVPPFHP
jgi:creatinine amidohydrolase